MTKATRHTTRAETAPAIPVVRAGWHGFVSAPCDGQAAIAAAIRRHAVAVGAVTPVRTTAGLPLGRWTLCSGGPELARYFNQANASAYMCARTAPAAKKASRTAPTIGKGPAI